MRPLLIPLMIAAAAAPLRAEVIEKRETQSYTIEGATIEGARKQMNERRPRGYDAYTEWKIRWDYSYRKTAAACSIASVKTHLDIVFHLPRLETQTPALQTSFRAYLQKLQLHEDGHAANGMTVARRVDSALPALPAASTCEEMGRSANALGERLVKEGNALDLDYDSRTRHGLTQGARWP